MSKPDTDFITKSADYIKFRRLNTQSFAVKMLFITIEDMLAAICAWTFFFTTKHGASREGSSHGKLKNEDHIT